MSVIEVQNLTKDYEHGRGVFGVSFQVEKGEVFGFLGPNGAGKTTTLRHLMGFLKPQRGSASINGLDCWKDSAGIKHLVGYVPGEIAIPDAPTGWDFLRQQAELQGVTNLFRAEEIVRRFQLDPTANLKRMSKGMKQKTALAAAFMANPDILILDEPTTGLDPLMRAEFVDLIHEEKKKGRTILMPSHMFEELEDTCDKVALIKDGKIVAIKSTREIRHLGRGAAGTVFAGFSAAADVLGMELTDLTADLGLLKENPDAMAAAVEASGLPEDQLTMLVNYALASSEVSADEQLEFDVFTYLMINLGWFLFLFAVGSISFAASCIFNLSKNSLALGGGLPVAFFVFRMLAQTGDGLEMFKYLSLNTLFDPNAILAGSGYGAEFIILAVVGIVLYIVGMEWFKRKDLPL